MVARYMSSEYLALNRRNRLIELCYKLDICIHSPFLPRRFDRRSDKLLVIKTPSTFLLCHSSLARLTHMSRIAMIQARNEMQEALWKREPSPSLSTYACIGRGPAHGERYPRKAYHQYTDSATTLTPQKVSRKSYIWDFIWGPSNEAKFRSIDTRQLNKVTITLTAKSHPIFYSLTIIIAEINIQHIYPRKT